MFPTTFEDKSEETVVKASEAEDGFGAEPFFVVIVAMIFKKLLLNIN